MAVLEINDLVAAGLDITTTAHDTPAAGGDVLPNGGGDAFLVVYNGGASNMTVTCPAQRTSVSREGFPTTTVPDITVTVPASKYRAVGPFPRAAYNNGNGQVVVQYSKVTSVTVLGCRLPRF